MQLFLAELIGSPDRATPRHLHPQAKERSMPAVAERNRDDLIVADTREVLYTLCPGPQASYFAVHFGWTADELAKFGGKLTYLRSIPDTKQIWPHVGHRSESLIREGGNWPPIWARADVSDTRLIATLTTDPSGGHILVRADSDFYRVTDLAGKKFGLLKGANTKKLDFGRVPAHRNIIAALRLAGLSPKDVTIIDIE